MNKREEIRKVIDTYTDDGCLFPDRSCNALCGGYCSSDTESYKCLMERLDKLGVVIQVDRELPKFSKCWDEDGHIFHDAIVPVTREDMKEAGFAGFERLIDA